MSRNEIAKRLLDIGKQKLLVKRTVYKFKNNPFFSTIFDEDAVESEFNSTVVNTINVLERYNINQLLINQREDLLTKLTDPEIEKINTMLSFYENDPEMHQSLFEKFKRTKTFSKVNKMSLEDLNKIWTASNGDLILDSEAYITGYLITAFNNNISKIYGKHQTYKRAFKEMIYLDSYDESEEMGAQKNRLEAHTAVDPLKEREYKEIIVEMARKLKEHDRRQNKINNNQKSQLSKLFCAIVNPRKVEETKELKDRFGWSSYLLRKNQEELMEKIREDFSEYQEEIISYLDEREWRNKAVN